MLIDFFQLSITNATIYLRTLTKTSQFVQIAGTCKRSLKCTFLIQKCNKISIKFHYSLNNYSIITIQLLINYFILDYILNKHIHLLNVLNKFVHFLIIVHQYHTRQYNIY